MRTPTFRSLSLALLASSLLLTAGCNRDRQQESPLADLASAEDHGGADDENALSGDLIAAAAPLDETVSASPAAAGLDALARLGGRCLTRTYVADTRTLTLDFGPTNCLCPDGRYRRGKIVVVFSGPDRRRHSGAVATRVGYFVNDNQHTGTRTFTAAPGRGAGSFDLDVNASVIFANNGGTHAWTAHREFTQTAGAATPTLTDDAYTVTGSATGTNRRGVSYSATIVQPLVKQFAPGCARHFVAGTVNIVNARSQSMLLNYDPTGTQACDNIASVTVNGRTRTITLR